MVAAPSEHRGDEAGAGSGSTFTLANGELGGTRVLGEGTINATAR